MQISKFKIMLLGVYITTVAIVVFLFFYYGVTSFLNPEYLMNNRDIIFSYIDRYKTTIATIYFVSSIIWVFLLGFASIPAIFAGLVFGSYLGSVLSIFSFTIGATLLYFSANKLFKDSISNYIKNKYPLIVKNIDENIFGYYFFLRCIPGIPFAIKNLIPVIFNMRISSYFSATFFSELTPTIILVSLCSGIGKALRAGENINFLILKKPEIYIPVIALGLFVLIANIIKKKYFYKQSKT